MTSINNVKTFISLSISYIHVWFIHYIIVIVGRFHSTISSPSCLYYITIFLTCQYFLLIIFLLSSINHNLLCSITCYITNFALTALSTIIYLKKLTLSTKVYFSLSTKVYFCSISCYINHNLL